MKPPKLLGKCFSKRNFSFTSFTPPKTRFSFNNFFLSKFLYIWWHPHISLLKNPELFPLVLMGQAPLPNLTIPYLEANVSCCCVFLSRDKRYMALRWKTEVRYSGFHSGSVGHSALTLSFICLTSVYETHRLAWYKVKIGLRSHEEI